MVKKITKAPKTSLPINLNEKIKKKAVKAKRGQLKENKG